MSVILTRDLYKTYNPDTIPVHALQGVSISIERGEFTAVVGPSGSGKSSLAGLLPRLLDADVGSVEIGSPWAGWKNIKSFKLNGDLVKLLLQ